ncbi:MAG: ATP-binding cassette domain-containing protein, partial [Pseudomonadales bacterium]
MTIILDNLSVDFDEHFQLQYLNWEVQSGQHWVISGGNGAGKSALIAALTGTGNIISGQIQGLPERIGVVSFAAQEALINQERQKDDADILDVISIGTPVRNIIFDDCLDPQTAQEMITKFDLDYLLDRAFRKLSTGESRKVMLVRALSCKPQLLLLDEPFEGLDIDTFALLQDYLQELALQVPMIMVLNRFDEIPAFITHIAYMEQGQLLHQIDKQDTEAYNNLYQLLHLKTTALSVPACDPLSSIPKLDPSQPLVRLTDLTIKYDEFVLIDKLNWTIEPNQHWQLSGPNGAGKTAVLSIITGD